MDIKQFYKKNKTLLMYVLGGLVTTAITVAAITFTSGGALFKGSTDLDLTGLNMVECVASPNPAKPYDEVTVTGSANYDVKQWSWDTVSETISPLPTGNPTKAKFYYVGEATIHARATDYNNEVYVGTCTVSVASTSGSQMKSITTIPTLNQVTIPVITPTCTSFTYWDWGVCDGTTKTQTRGVKTTAPTGCQGGNPVISQSCIPSAECTAASRPQTQSCTLKLDMTGGTGSQTRTCIVSTGKWGEWSTCTSSKDAPALTLTDNHSDTTSPVACTSFTYTPGTCVNGSQPLTVLTRTPANCSGGVAPLQTQACTVVPNACQYSYSSFGACNSSGIQTRTVTDATPAGCSGTPVLSQGCTPTSTSSNQSNTNQSNTSQPYYNDTPTTGTTQPQGPGPDILTCKADADTLVLDSKLAVRVDCSISKPALVTAQVIAGIYDPAQAPDESVLARTFFLDQSQPAKAFYMLWDGKDKYDSFVGEGEYTFLVTAKLSKNAAADYSLQKITVMQEAPAVDASGTGEETNAGSQNVDTGATATPTDTAAKTPTTAAAPEAPPEPSKCTGVNYPRDIKGHWAESFIKQAYDLCLIRGYEDGTFHADQPVTRAEAVKMVLSAAGIPPISGCYDADCGSPFMDLEAWQGPWIKAAWNLKIVKGVGADRFAPNRGMSRAEAAVVVDNAFKIAPFKGCYTANCGAGHPTNFFLDIKDTWQGPYIRGLWDAGLINGTGPNKFEPNRPITRAELTKLILKGKEMKK